MDIKTNQSNHQSKSSNKFKQNFPQPTWASDEVYFRLCQLYSLKRFEFLPDYISQTKAEDWNEILHSMAPHKENFPGIQQKIHQYTEISKLGQGSYASFESKGQSLIDRIIEQIKPHQSVELKQQSELRNPFTRFLLLRALRPDSL
ncbi:MAG: hypothetical protein EZS28_053310, partial [Streblomastix strix]